MASNAILLAILVIFLSDLASATLPRPCDNGYQALGRDHCFKWHVLYKTYYNARKHCQSEDADLLVLNNKEINDQFKAWTTFQFGWMGLSKGSNGYTSNYAWLDEGDMVTHFNNNVTIPYFENLPSNIKVGSEIIIKGDIHKDCKRIGLYLFTSQDSSSDIGMYFNARFDKAQFGLNHRKGGKFGVEARGPVAMKVGEAFEIRIKAQPSGYRLFLNNKWYSDFLYYVDVDSIKTLRLYGQVNVHSITVLDRTQVEFSDFLGNYKADYSLAKCGMFSYDHAWGLKGWSNEPCALNRPFFCAYNREQVPTKSVIPCKGCWFECPDSSWTLSEGYCFKASIQSSLSFAQAQKASYKYGAELARITSHAQRDAVKGMLKAGSSYWIGTLDINTEGMFTYINGQQMPPKNVFSPWAKDEPNNITGNNDDCVEMGADGLWRDSECNAKRAYVAGVKAEQVSKCRRGFYPMGADLCVKYHSEAKSFYMAREESKRHGADLLVLNDQAAFKLFTESYSSLNLFGWVGLNRIESGFSYKWLDTAAQETSVNTWFLIGETEESLLSENCVTFAKDAKTGKYGLERSACTERRPFFSGYSRSQVSAPASSVYTNTYACLDSSWLLVDRTCIKAFHDQGTQTYAGAQAAMARYGGSLAAIFDADMDQKVKGLTKKGSEYWIGLSDEMREGTFEDVNGRAMPPKEVFNPWNDGEPNNYSDNEDCLQIRKDGTWNDRTCNRKLNWVGQMPAHVACKCSNLTITPNDTTVYKGEDVVIRFDASGIEASKIISMKVHKLGNILSSVVLIGDGFIHASKDMPKRIHVQGQVNESDIEKSYMSVTFPKPTPERSGIYVATVQYVDKDGAVRNAVDTAALFVEKTSACPEGWTFYNHKCYRDILVYKSHHHARVHCKGAAGQLARIYDQATNDFLQHDFPWRYPQQPYYMALYDKDRKGSFTLDGVKATYVNWAPDYPVSGKYDACVVFYPNTGMWKNLRCYNTLRFLCEANPREVTERFTRVTEESIFS